MATRRRTRSDQGNLITQEAESVRNSYTPDPTYDGNSRGAGGVGGLNDDLGVGGGGPGRGSKAGRIIDQLLASVPQNQGFYLKLLKEIAPNQFQFKQQILNYDTWSDLQLEIANIVKANTIKYPRSWGTGLYRVIVWRDQGIRDAQGIKPFDFYIDACDEGMPDTNGHVNGNGHPMVANDPLSVLSTVTPLIETIQKMMPQAADPAKTQDMIGNAYMKGMEATKENGNSTNTMMLGFMTVMMNTMEKMANMGRQPVDVTPKTSLKSEMLDTFSLMKEFGFNQHKPEPPKSLIETLGELRTLGFEPFKQQDPMEQITKVKSLMGLVSDIMGNKETVEAPATKGVFEGLIESIAPHIPKILEVVQASAMTRMQPPPQQIVYANGGGGAHMPSQQMPAEPPNVQPQPATPEIDPAMRLLYETVISKDNTKFPVVQKMMEGVDGGSALIANLRSGLVPVSLFYSMVSNWTAPLMKDAQFASGLREFVNKYVEYLKNPISLVPQAEPEATAAPMGPSPMIDTKCQSCGRMYAFKTVEEYNEDNKKCDAQIDHDGTMVDCPGTIARV